MTTRTWVILLGIAAVAFACWTLHLGLQRKERAMTALANLPSNSTAHLPGAPALASHAQPADNQASEVKSTGDTASAANKASIDVAAELDRLAVKRELREAEAYRSELVRTHGLFYRLMNLSPAQIAVFENATVEHWLMQRDIWAARSALKLENSDPALTKMRQQARHDRDRALQSILGTDGILRLAQFEDARRWTAVISNRVELTPDPMTPAEADAVTTALLPHYGTSRNLQNYLEVAKKVLPPDRFKVVEQIYADEHIESELARRVRLVLERHRGTSPSK